MVSAVGPVVAGRVIGGAENAWHLSALRAGSVRPGRARIASRWVWAA